ncbi:MAG: hypothetical protein WCX16_06635 [Candidatus Omnitrophota bacterium]
MKQRIKAKNFFLIVCVCILSLLTSSCIYFVAGGVGALGGYAVSPDTVEGEAQADYDTLWDASTQVVSIMGTVQTKDYKLGTLQGLVNGAKITIDLSQISSNDVRLRVKARKNMLPNIKMAQDIFVKIKNQARQ